MKKGVIGCGLALLAAALLLGAGCDSSSKTGSGKTGEGDKPKEELKTPEVIYVSGIPDSSTSVLRERFDTVIQYLSKETGLKFEYFTVKDYQMFQDNFLNGKIHMAFFGGVTGVETIDHPNNKIGSEIIVTRDIDLNFKTYFIANKKLVGDGAGLFKPTKDWTNTAGLKTFLKDKKFTFGSDKSTSGHAMPRFFMYQAGIDPEEVCGEKNIAYSGGHDKTIAQVADGTCDVGVCNYTNWENSKDDVKANAPIIAVTPEYPDYIWMANKNLPAADIEKIRKAFLNLNTDNPDHRKVLDITGNAPNKQKKFVTADSKNWDPIREVLRDLKARKKVKEGK